MSILQQWMITVGILAAFLVALVILWALPHSARTLDWRLILGVGAVPALVGVVLRTRMTESPRWLLRHGRFEDTRRAQLFELQAAGDRKAGMTSPRGADAAAA